MLANHATVRFRSVLITANEKQQPPFVFILACVAPAASQNKNKWSVCCMLCSCFSIIYMFVNCISVRAGGAVAKQAGSFASLVLRLRQGLQMCLTVCVGVFARCLFYCHFFILFSTKSVNKYVTPLTKILIKKVSKKGILKLYFVKTENIVIELIIEMKTLI